MQDLDLNTTGAAAPHHAGAHAIRDGAAGDVQALVDTLSDSFSHDPVLNWVIPRRQLYPDYFNLLVREVYLPRGMIHMEREGRAAALWLPPEQRYEMAPRLALLRLGLRLLLHEGPRPLWRLRQQGRLYERHLPAEPHYYLQFIGCRQEHRGQGIGNALLERGTGVCDQQGMPAYLESSNALNVPLYKRHGFEVRARAPIAAGGPTTWFMWRKAR
ncbi:MAG: GNAT family N-acetyltransferase [Halioglobus sp.]|nr:GNAT family N-acetyltransferase [Halioglobus sp.]